MSDLSLLVVAPHHDGAPALADVLAVDVSTRDFLLARERTVLFGFEFLVRIVCGDGTQALAAALNLAGLLELLDDLRPARVSLHCAELDGHAAALHAAFVGERATLH